MIVYQIYKNKYSQFTFLLYRLY